MLTRFSIITAFSCALKTKRQPRGTPVWIGQAQLAMPCDFGGHTTKPLLHDRPRTVNTGIGLAFFCAVFGKRGSPRCTNQQADQELGIRCLGVEEGNSGRRHERTEPCKHLPKHVRQRTENRQGAEGLRGWMGEVSLAEARSSQDGRGHILFRADEPAASDAMAPAQRSPSTIGHPFRPLILPTTPLPPVLHPISSHLWWPRARTPFRPQSPPRALINRSRLPARRSLV